MTIEWNDRYRIGDPEIDAQHQAWFGKINDFLSVSEQIANETIDLVKWRNFLSSWLIHHIAVTDQAFASYIESE